MKKTSKRILALLLTLVMIIPMSSMALAVNADVSLGRTKLGDAVLEKGTPSSSTYLRNVDGDYTTKVPGETGLWQRLPTNTLVGYGTVTPVNYAVPAEGSVEVSQEGIIGDVSFSLEPWAGDEFTTNPPCLQFNYTAEAVGTVEVTVTYFYNYGLVNISNGRTWYKETATFTINVVEGELTKPDKPTVSDVERFRNYVNSTSSSKGAVYMWCDTYDHHAWFDYITDVDDAYTLGDVVANDGSVLSKSTYPWICVMTLDANKYLDAYNDELGGECGTHYLKDGQAATETATWYYNANLSKWQFRSAEAPVYIDITHTQPVTEYTVTYTDGVDGAAFADKTYTVKSGDPTPAFEGTPTREGYVFLGWEPEVAETVTGNATYTAQWEEALTSVTVKSNIKEGKLLFLGDTFTVTATANTSADMTLAISNNAGTDLLNNAFEVVSTDKSADGTSTTYTLKVIKIVGAYQRLNITATATKGTQEPVTSEKLSFGVNLRNRIHVTLTQEPGNEVVNDATLRLVNKWSKNASWALKFDAAKSEYVMANMWDLSNQDAHWVEIVTADGRTYTADKTRDGKDLYKAIKAGTEEIYVDYTIVSPVTVTIYVDGEQVAQKEYVGNKGDAVSYGDLYWSVMDQLKAENKTPIVTIENNGETGSANVFGSCTTITINMYTK